MISVLLKLVVALLLGVAIYAFWIFSSLFTSPGSFQTEGSPAGTGMAVIVLLTPVIGLAALAAAVVVATIDWGIGRLRRDLASDTRSTAATHWDRQASAYTHPRGGRIEAVFAQDRAVLFHRPEPSAPGWRTQRTGYAGRPDALLPFRGVKGALLHLPVSWTVDEADARQALQFFIQYGERSEQLQWQAMTVSADSEQIWSRLSLPAAAP
ncbi:MAG: hypothetical protein R3F15_19710 [Lysobacterales bacterium]